MKTSPDYSLPLIRRQAQRSFSTCLRDEPEQQQNQFCSAALISFSIMSLQQVETLLIKSSFR
jgi:hypothetical protein